MNVARITEKAAEPRRCVRGNTNKAFTKRHRSAFSGENFLEFVAMGVNFQQPLSKQTPWKFVINGETDLK